MCAKPGHMTVCVSKGTLATHSGIWEAAGDQSSGSNLDCLLRVSTHVSADRTIQSNDAFYLSAGTYTPVYTMYVYIIYTYSYMNVHGLLYIHTFSAAHVSDRRGLWREYRRGVWGGGADQIKGRQDGDMDWKHAKER